MADMQQRRIDIRREYTDLNYEGMGGVNAVAANVDESRATFGGFSQWAKFIIKAQ